MSAPTIEYREVLALVALLAVLWLLVYGRGMLDRRDAAARLADRQAREDARYNTPTRRR